MQRSTLIHERLLTRNRRLPGKEYEMNYWDYHGIWFLLGLAFFPRLTMLFFVATPFGLFAWLGWLITPRFLVAVLALAYWPEHPVLVIIAWVWAMLWLLASIAKVARAGR